MYYPTPAPYPKPSVLFSANDVQSHLLCLTFKILSHPFLPVSHDYLQHKASTPHKVVYPPPPEHTGSIPVSWPWIVPSSLLRHPPLSSPTRSDTPPSATSRKYSHPVRKPLYTYVSALRKDYDKVGCLFAAQATSCRAWKCAKMRTCISPQLLSFNCVCHKNQVHGQSSIKLN